MNDSTSASQCDTTRLIDYLKERLSIEDEVVLVRHLDQCSSCRRKLSATAASKEVWTNAADFLKNDAKDLELLGVMDSGHDQDRSDRSIHQIKQVLDILAPTDDPRSMGRLGPYEINGVVGSGGMGVVLKATEKSLDRTVAIKVLAPHLGSNGAARRRFAREARATAAVLHPNVVAIHGVSNEAALPYLVMPYIAGRSLQDRLDTDGPLELIEILRISQQIASGLAASHAQGLVHRDIKPANVLLQDGVERVTITDFGLARAVDDASMTRTGVIAGTPQFMSPEQARGDSIDCRSDLFSLGSVMYTMCTGHPPFRAETSYGVLRRITDDAPRNIRERSPVIPVWLVTLVNLLLEKTPEKRFESASKLEVVLKQCIAHVEQPAKQPLPIEVLAKRATKRRLWLVAAIIPFIAILLYQVPIAPSESPAPISQTPILQTPTVQTPITEAPDTQASRKAGPLETPDARASSIAALVEKLEAAIDTESQVSHRDSLEIPFANGESFPISNDRYEPWMLTLDECISIALQTNSFVKSLDHTKPEDPQVSLANFEVQVRNLVRDVENAYWDLFVSNQRISVAMVARSQAITVAQLARINLDNGTGTVQELAQAVGHYYQFRGLVESLLAGSNTPGFAQIGMYGREQALRKLLGLAVSDGRLIWPVDAPTNDESNRTLTTDFTQAMRLSPEIKKQHVRLNQLELELVIRKKLLESKYPQLHLHDWVNSDVEPPQRFEIVATMIEALAEATRFRGGELRLEREKANLEESSRVLITLLTDAFTKTSTIFQLMHTSLRRWQAAATEVHVRTAEFKNGRTPANVVLQSSQRQADASADYYQAFAEYRKSCSHIDYLSGTLLASKNINISGVTWRSSSSKE